MVQGIKDKIALPNHIGFPDDSKSDQSYNQSKGHRKDDCNCDRCRNPPPLVYARCGSSSWLWILVIIIVILIVIGLYLMYHYNQLPKASPLPMTESIRPNNPNYLY